MALYVRLLSKNVFKANVASIGRWRAMSSVSTSKKFEKNPYWDEKDGLEFEARNKKLGRPLSPHLSAYEVQNNMVVSMGHRITGLILYGAMFGLAAGAVFLPGTFPHYLATLADLHAGAASVTALKLLVVFPFASHVTSGVRHLVTDSGYFLTVKGVRYTGWASVVVSVAFALYLATL